MKRSYLVKTNDRRGDFLVAEKKKRGSRQKSANKKKITKGESPGESGFVAPQTDSDTASRRATDGFPIVGIGASAGGLEAFTLLLNHLPTDTGLAFVLVQHLDPQHESALVQILKRATSMPVREVTNNLRVEVNQVYVIPPNTNLTISEGVLKLGPRHGGRRPPRSIDSFFESLAQEQRERAIGVILSGTASDGTLGLEAIKAEGGITLAQDDSARYDSMPRSAVAAGCVDFVLSPEDIAKELTRIAKHPYVAGQPPGHVSAENDRAVATAHEDDETPLPSGGHGSPRTGARRAQAEKAGSSENAGASGYKKILLLLRNHCGVDFSLYKSTTIQRRITRRLVLSKRNTLEEYAQFLRGNTKELDALYSDVLISVTSFFRNPEAFDLLKRKVFPNLLQQRRNEPVRVWVLGCSTGQEAYSIAMAFAESTEKVSRARKLQVFATDLNDALLDKARHGLYAKSLAQDVSPERLRRFFVEEEGGYRVTKALREMVVFARQNLISDPPFSRIDLISCRNLMIYLEPSVQKKAFPSFHYALRPGGFLFLGASESVGSFTELFEPVDKKSKIFSKRAAPTPAFYLPKEKGRAVHTSPRRTPPPSFPLPKGQGHAPEGFRAELSAQREADRIMVNEFAPPGVLINAELQILQFRGPTSSFLEPPTGKANFDVLKMAREGLMLPLRTAINKAKKEMKTTRKENVRVRQNGTIRTVNVEVIPLKNLRESCFLILFEDGEKAGRAVPGSVSRYKPAGEAKPRLSKREESRRIADLERDLAETRDYLQSVQEQNEASNEELQASNEEIQSANEELQSVNEELETSKEELESANEELTTVNEEMANRNAELNRLNSDLGNLQTSTKLAIVLLGRDLTIRRFSPQAEKQFNLLAADLGRPFGIVRHNLIFPKSTDAEARTSTKGAENQNTLPIESIIKEVIDTVRPQERDVQDEDGRWYSLRVRPYMTSDNKVDGAVLVLVDINEIKTAEQEARAAREYAESAIRTTRDPMVVLRADLRVNTANEAFYKTFKTTPDQTEGRLIFEVADERWNIPKLRTLLEEILPRNSFFNNFEVTHDFPRTGRRTMRLNARRLDQRSGTAPLILLSIEDVTERDRLDERVRLSEIRYRRLFEASHHGVLVLNPVSRKITDANPFMTELLGYTPEELIGKELWQIGLLKDEPSSRAAFRELQRSGVIRYEDFSLQTKSGETRAVEVVANSHDEGGAQVIQYNIRDITEREQAGEALRENQALLRFTLDAAQVGDWDLDLVTDKARRSLRHDQCFGYGEPAPEWGFETFIQHVHPDDRTEVERQFREAVAQLKDWHFECRVIWPDGSVHWIAAHGSIYRTSEAKPRRMLGIVANITDRKRAEEVSARLASVVESSEDAIVSKDLNSIISTWNHGAERLFGYTAREAVGQSVVMLISPDHLDEEPFILARIREGESIEHYETVRRRKDGTLVDVSLTVSPIRNDRGQIIGVSTIARDISHRKRNEETLRKAQAQLADRAGQLEQAVVARTEELTEMNKQLEAFVYTIAHDLRAPLRAMQGFSSMLVEDEGASLSETGQDLANRVNHSAQFMDAILKDLLDFSRISQERLELSVVDLGNVVENVVSRLEKEAQEKNARIENSKRWPAVLAHNRTLEQVLFNLVSNAMKFVAPGVSPLVRLTAEERGEFVRVWVIDNGIGISFEHQEEVFRLFARLHGERFPGTGIGLTIVQKGLERMRGQVGVEQGPDGQGSRFWFELRKA